MPARVPCPLCAGQIRPEATRCRYCRSRLVATDPARWHRRLPDRRRAGVSSAVARAPRVLEAAGPLLVRNARRDGAGRLARTLAAALVPLPAILVAHVWVLGWIYDLLRGLLPGPLSLYLVANYAGMLALLLALTYGAIPLLAARQLAAAAGERHG